MKIAAAQQTLSSQHLAQEHREISERLRSWVGNRPSEIDDQQPTKKQSVETNASPVNISALGRSMAAQAARKSPIDLPAPPVIEQPETSALSAALKSSDNDPAIAMLRNMLERVFGIKVKTFDAAELQGSSTHTEDLQKIQRNATFGLSGDQNAWGVEYEYHEQYTETESTRFSAEGIVETEDGQRFEFKLSLEMTRTYSERIDTMFRAGNAVRAKDPLIFSFAGPAAQLADQRFQIDLDDDGTLDTARFAAQGSGFLVFDKNEDGKINSGKEMFGPSTGDGFAELAMHDADQNGWIDENDPIYAHLKIWTKSIEGVDALRGLKDSNVGAISLGRLATPFAIKDAENQLLGQVRGSSVYLTDDGKVGAVQQVDLVV